MANRLAAESSAYLRQHRANPVDWYAWGPEPWERARREHRPVLVSIGYSSCHWCHVMERESFESEEIARVMNEHLVCIKVDREERPDVDQIYMDAVVRMTGQGGWPLNVFCTPDGRPFHGGTYFPPQPMHGRPSWPELVRAVARVWREEPDQVEEQAARVLQALATRPSVDGASASTGLESLHALCMELMQRADRQHGGFGGAPKFPTPANLEAVLAASHLHVAGPGALDHVAFTLERMARGGIYDQLGGGFHRYSTDAQWLVPHFEKMLYDNGQLLRVFAEAWRQTGDDQLAWPVEETVDWLEREMRDPRGGFCASQDADSEGEEGRFFVWSPDEIREVLGPERGDAFCQAYGVASGGNFEHGKSVLAHGLAGERARLRPERQELLAARAKRVAPATDPKQICAWIGYAIGGLASAGATFERDAWVAAAARAADFALEVLSDGGRDLLRIPEAGGTRIPAFLDDHGALLCGLLDLHRAGGDDVYLQAALLVARAIAERFWDPEARDLFFVPGDDPTLVLRPTSDHDGATPAAVGLAALGLVRLAGITERPELRRVADALLETHGPLIARVPLHAPTLARAAALAAAGPGMGLVLGKRSDPRSVALARRARALLGPDDAVVVVEPDAPPDWLAPDWLEGRRSPDDAPVAYLCRGRVCSLPARAPDELALPQTGVA